MAATASALVLWTPAVPRRWRLFFVVFLVRMWRLNAIARLTLPLPRTRKRFFALLFVFILGMISTLFAAHGGALRRRDFLTSLGLGCRSDFRCDLFRREQHHHLPPFEPWPRLDDAVRLEI